MLHWLMVGSLCFAMFTLVRTTWRSGPRIRIHENGAIGTSATVGQGRHAVSVEKLWHCERWQYSSTSAWVGEHLDAELNRAHAAARAKSNQRRNERRSA